MQQITIQYRPFLHPLKRTISGSFPDKVEELNAAQLEAVASLVGGTIGDDNFLARMTGIKQRIIRRLAPFYKFRLLELFTVFNDLTPHNQFIIDKIQCRNTTFTAPAPKLKGVTFGQFIFAESLFATWLETKNTADLHRFVAALYLPAGEPVFTEDVIDKNAALLATAPVEVMEAVAINYRMIHLWLSNAYPIVFPEDESQSANDSPPVSGGVPEGGGGHDPAAVPAAGGGNSSGTSTTWLKIFRNLVGDDLVNEDKYAKLPVNNVLRFLSEKIKQNMKRRK